MTRCPRCNGRLLNDYEGELWCIACGTLRSTPNPDALLDRQRAAPNQGAVNGYFGKATKPHEDQLPLAFDPRPPRVVKCARCGTETEQAGPGQMRRYCSAICRVAAYRERGREVLV
jgi:hypothetical protein